MAKKTSKTRKTTKASSRKKTARGASSAKNSASRKSAREKTPARQATSKRPVVKKSTRAAAGREVVRKPTHKKKVAKKPARRVIRKAAKKSPRKVAGKTVKRVVRPLAGKAGLIKAPPVKPPHKGITIIAKKPMRRRRAPRAPTVIPKIGRGLLEPGVKRPKPLIASGPKNVPSASDPASRTTGGIETKKKSKSPFNKRQLKKFRDILLRKRAELVGDVSEMEREALLSGGSGGLSHTPSHMAEQGSDTYDQTLSLNIAAVDRKLIKEIDDALARIEKGTYGLCVLSGRPIRTERLEELPWAKHSIDTAREIERRSMRL